MPALASHAPHAMSQTHKTGRAGGTNYRVLRCSDCRSKPPLGQSFRHHFRFAKMTTVEPKRLQRNKTRNPKPLSHHNLKSLIGFPVPRPLRCRLTPRAYRPLKPRPPGTTRLLGAAVPTPACHASVKRCRNHADVETAASRAVARATLHATTIVQVSHLRMVLFSPIYDIHHANSCGL